MAAEGIGDCEGQVRKEVPTENLFVSDKSTHLVKLGSYSTVQITQTLALRQ